MPGLRGKLFPSGPRVTRGVLVGLAACLALAAAGCGGAGSRTAAASSRSSSAARGAVGQGPPSPLLSGVTAYGYSSSGSEAASTATSTATGLTPAPWFAGSGSGGPLTGISPSRTFQHALVGYAGMLYVVAWSGASTIVEGASSEALTHGASLSPREDYVVWQEERGSGPIRFAHLTGAPTVPVQTFTIPPQVESAVGGASVGVSGFTATDQLILHTQAGLWQASLEGSSATRLPSALEANATNDAAQFIPVGESRLAYTSSGTGADAVVLVDDNFKPIATLPATDLRDVSADGRYLLVARAPEPENGELQQETCVVSTLQCRPAPSSAGEFFPNDELLLSTGTDAPPSPLRGAFYNPATGATTQAPAAWSQFRSFDGVIPTALLSSVVKVIGAS
jgi:hypothetical protein